MTPYVIGQTTPGAYACTLEALQHVTDDFELLKGISRKDAWPGDAAFRMDGSTPEDTRLEDLLFNTNGVLVVSDRWKSLLTAADLKQNEWLPVQIINHKGRKVAEPYHILHQVHLQDCLDPDNSVAIPNPINPDIFMEVTSIAIDASRVDPEVQLFRMARFPYIPLFHRDLAKKIADAGLSGITFLEITEWEGF